jgi:hypothetical protein
MPPATKCFVAYPSRPESLSETIEAAVDLINGTQVVDATPWRSLAVTGRLVIKEICDAINANDLFMCDLTFLNPNVLFELGFAVARNKRIWLTIDSSYDLAIANYKQVKLLTTVGYSTYHNATEIVNAFLDEQPYGHLDRTLYADVIETLIGSGPRPPSLLYLKSSVNTEASARLTRRLHKSTIPMVTDDPAEITVQTLAWYAQAALSAHAVIAHLLDDTRSTTAPVQNAKYAFVSGLAHGLGKPLLMLAHSPYQPPFDYQELLRVHSSAGECVTILDAWLQPIEDAYHEDRQRYAEHRRDGDAALALRRIHLGDHIAENEQSQLLDYFIETASYTEALHASQSLVFVGRKGTGKTANLYKIANELGRDKRIHVCVVQPIDYDLEGVLRLLRLSLPVAEHGYLIESLWKFLIYTQIAISIYEDIRARPIHIPLEDEEANFARFVESEIAPVEADFTVRMEAAIADLCSVDFSAGPAAQRVKVSEILHDTIIARLRTELGRVLGSRERVCVLVDNLDKAWRPRQDLSELAEFIFGLLDVARAITQEFGRAGPSWRPLDLSLVVFLRSDIFSYIMAMAREVDKLSFSRIDWSDPRLLERIVEERFISSAGGDITPDDVWDRFFAPTVRGMPTRQYIMSRILPRPRDILYLCKASLAYSINHGHSRIEEVDVIAADKDYSEYAFRSLVAETKPVLPLVEELLVEFAGAPQVVSKGEVSRFMSRAAISTQGVNETLDLLTESLFLAPEVEPGRFEFLYDEARKNVLRSLGRATAQRTGHERYMINVPFHSYLGIEASSQPASLLPQMR